MTILNYTQQQNSNYSFFHCIPTKHIRQVSVENVPQEYLCTKALKVFDSIYNCMLEDFLHVCFVSFNKETVGRQAQQFPDLGLGQ